MVDTLTFKVKKRQKIEIEFYLAPEEEGSSEPDGPYHFLAPKSAMMVLPVLEDSDDQSATLRAIFDWLGMGLNRWDWVNVQNAAPVTIAEGDSSPVLVPKEMPEDYQGPQAQRIEARLRDDGDDLDIDSLSEVIQGLTEKVADRPTT